jgi:hypothetical protein
MDEQEIFLVLLSYGADAFLWREAFQQRESSGEVGAAGSCAGNIWLIHCTQDNRTVIERLGNLLMAIVRM